MFTFNINEAFSKVFTKPLELTKVVFEPYDETNTKVTATSIEGDKEDTHVTYLDNVSAMNIVKSSLRYGSEGKSV
jgi:hypothetical protein